MYSPNDNSFKLTVDETTTVLEHPMTMGARLEVSTDALATEFFGSTTTKGNLFPPVVRYVSSDFLKFIVERPPTTVKILYKDAKQGNHSIEPKEVKLNLPWMVYAIQFAKRNGVLVLASLYVYGRNTPLFSEDETLYYVPLPNTYANGSVCLDYIATSLFEGMNASDYQTILNAVINAFWDAPFNNDLDAFHTARYVPETIGNMVELTCDGFYSPATIIEAWASLSEYDVLEMAFAPALTPYSFNDYTWDNPATPGVFIRRWEQDDQVPLAGSQPFLTFIRQLALQIANK